MPKTRPILSPAPRGMQKPSASKYNVIARRRAPPRSCGPFSTQQRLANFSPRRHPPWSMILAMGVAHPDARIGPALRMGRRAQTRTFRAMTFRAKFLTLFSLAVLAGTGVLAWGATAPGAGGVRAIRPASATPRSPRNSKASSPSAARKSATPCRALRMRRARCAWRSTSVVAQADPSVYANDARGLAAAHQLDFLDLVGADGTLISSAQWPARSGYKNDWVATEQDWNQRGAFLQRVELPDGVDLGLLAVRVVSVAPENLYLIGGRRLDREFLGSVALPAGTRALLYSQSRSGISCRKRWRERTAPSISPSVSRRSSNRRKIARVRRSRRSSGRRTRPAPKPSWPCP